MDTDSDEEGMEHAFAHPFAQPQDDSESEVSDPGDSANALECFEPSVYADTASDDEQEPSVYADTASEDEQINTNMHFLAYGGAHESGAPGVDVGMMPVDFV